MFTFVIFGVTGDLAQRKLLPALHALHVKQKLTNVNIVGFGRKVKGAQEFHNDITHSVETYSKRPVEFGFLEKFSYLQGKFDDPASYEALRKKIGSTQAIYYFSTPPDLFNAITEQLKHAGMTKEHNGWPRVVFEKPFGSDLGSATDLQECIHHAFNESQIYRVDHYLGKSAIQNLLVFRFSNAIFEPLLSNKYVDNIQITAAETRGVGDRGGYYDEAGALRDVVQNHLLQVLALLTMEAPRTLGAEDIRDKKVELLRHIDVPTEKTATIDVVRGQYTSKETNHYRQERGVREDSTTETFVALKLHVNNERWKHVPVYLRAGKRLAENRVDITVQFKRTADKLFGEQILDNVLKIEVQPEEGISIRFNTKTPNTKMHVTPVHMNFTHVNKFGPNTPEAYENIIADIFTGDKTLFTRWDEVERSWEIVQPILDAWKKTSELEHYEAGSWGPEKAQTLIENDGRTWQ